MQDADYADQADSADYGDYADYAEYADFAEYADYAGYAEYAEQLTADGAHHCPVGSIWPFFYTVCKSYTTAGHGGHDKQVWALVVHMLNQWPF